MIKHKNIKRLNKDMIKIKCVGEDDITYINRSHILRMYKKYDYDVENRRRLTFYNLDVAYPNHCITFAITKECYDELENILVE